MNNGLSPIPAASGRELVDRAVAVVPGAWSAVFRNAVEIAGSVEDYVAKGEFTIAGCSVKDVKDVIVPNSVMGRAQFKHDAAPVRAVLASCCVTAEPGRSENLSGARI